MAAGTRVRVKANGHTGKVIRMWDEDLVQVAWDDGTKGVIFVDRVEVMGC